MRGLLVRIGIDATFGRWNAPLDIATNEFVYVPIPEPSTAGFHRGCRRPYTEVVPVLERFAARRRVHLWNDLRFPKDLPDQAMHLDPDFTTLTYGDCVTRRGADMGKLKENDLLVFYAGLRPTRRESERLVYALVGIFVVQEVVPAADIPKSRLHENAHTRKLDTGRDDIVIRAKPTVSGRLSRAIPVGSWRDGAYRIRNEVLDAWGGLSVLNGYVQRSVRPPHLRDPQRFANWLSRQQPILEATNF